MDRIGIRFINLIDPLNGNLAEFIKPDLIALEDTDESEEIAINYMESRRHTGDNQELIIKVSKSIGGSVLPEEFANNLHIKMTKTRSSDHLTALLDFDHLKIYDGAELDIGQLLKDIDILHKKSMRFFIGL